MGISFVGLGVSLAIIAIAAAIIYYWCCRKKKASSSPGQVVSPSGPVVRPEGFTGNISGPGYPTGPSNSAYMPSGGSAPVGWNVDQTGFNSGATPYGSTLISHSGPGGQNPSAPPPPYSPPPYPQ